MSWKETVKERSRKLKEETATLLIVCRKPETPLLAKIITGIVVAYALSPIDLIPDFIPVLGYLDDLILLPLGISLALKCIPKELLDQSRAEARDLFKEGKPKNWFFGGLIIMIWIALLLYGGRLLLQLVR